MNRVKLTIKDENGNCLCKVGTSIEAKVREEYSNEDLIALLDEIKEMLMYDTK